MEEAELWKVIGGVLVKENKGFTLVELIIVMACLGIVLIFFWTMLSSSSEDTSTITEKVEVQNSVTSLMNIIQQDVQEAKIYNISESEAGIVNIGSNAYSFSNVNYTFDSTKKTVTRETSEGSSVYNDIVSFSMERATGSSKYGVNVKITGGKKSISERDKSRYSLESMFYSRNTIM